MSTWGITWLVVLIVASVLYFAVAIFVIIKGGKDLRELFAGGTEEPPEDVKRQMELYDQLKATADLDVQRELMNEIIDIAIENFHRIGVSLDMGQYGVVKNNYYNVPLAMPESWNYPDPFPTNPSTYWIGPE